jgi:Spy/CpxP family protein refolding chaperone
MKRIALAASLLLAASAAFAQAPAPASAPARPAPEVPKPKCEPKPEFPGRLAMTSDSRRRLFQREYKDYSDCMKAYVQDRQAASEANLAAGNAAVVEFNDVAKKLNEAQAEANK